MLFRIAKNKKVKRGKQSENDNLWLEEVRTVRIYSSKFLKLSGQLRIERILSDCGSEDRSEQIG